MSISACSNVTSQKTNLKGFNQIVENFRKKVIPKTGGQIYFQIDAAAFTSHDRLNLSEFGYDQVDFVAISPHKNLGGTESVGILIVRK